MIQTCLISQPHVRGTGRWAAVVDLRAPAIEKHGVKQACDVDDIALTQPHFAQPYTSGIAREQRNTHGVRTNG